MSLRQVDAFHLGGWTIQTRKRGVPSQAALGWLTE